jgi:O-acetyl-ADP-ribose deacetylase (regulator of RNase III)
MVARIEIVKGDITRMPVDAIVNAAQSSLRAGGGVDGAIHRAAGPKLQLECYRLHGCPTGEAKITQGYDLPAKWVIHTVGPIWRGGELDEDELLARCYRNTLALAAASGIRTIAFPAISTGAYRFPLHRATAIAVREVNAFLANDTQLETVYFVCYDERTHATYLGMMGQTDM